VGVLIGRVTIEAGATDVTRSTMSHGETYGDENVEWDARQTVMKLRRTQMDLIAVRRAPEVDAIARRAATPEKEETAAGSESERGSACTIRQLTSGDGSAYRAVHSAPWETAGCVVPGSAHNAVRV
jgi:hypothetical protein